jgi:hypothetical protein
LRSMLIEIPTKIYLAQFSKSPSNRSIFASAEE